ncbi:MAG: MoxR family ATPase [Gemmataceae bacterium]|nr:MoxR family ATPase [Gemmataceae bacterium]MCI0739839.1 MoxR family ATPase [Gemmataceae bacterium]
MTANAESDVQMLESLRAAYKQLRGEIGKIIVGQDAVLEQLMMAIFCRAHALLEGVPGLAKTLMVSTLAQALDLTFKRIQFTPDLMPTDITGTEVIQDDPATRQRMFKFLPGPIFANIVLADEINRTPPKTQAALLESMQERKASIGGVDHPMMDPFFVLATQNPIEQEGTYPLPEAQLDRFLFKIRVDYPTDSEEEQIMRLGTSDAQTAVSKVLHGDDIVRLQHIVRRVPVADHVIQYAKRITRMSRPGRPEAADFVNKWLTWGAGPRASMNLVLAAKAHAVLCGLHHVSADDVAAVAPPILRHRLIPNFTAQSEGVSVEDIIRRLVSAVPKNQAA